MNIPHFKLIKEQEKDCSMNVKKSSGLGLLIRVIKVESWNAGHLTEPRRKV